MTARNLLRNKGKMDVQHGKVMNGGDRVKKGASFQRPTIHRIGAVLPYHNNVLRVHRHGHNACVTR